MCTLRNRVRSYCLTEVLCRCRDAIQVATDPERAAREWRERPPHLRAASEQRPLIAKLQMAARCSCTPSPLSTPLCTPRSKYVHHCTRKHIADGTGSRAVKESKQIATCGEKRMWPFHGLSCLEVSSRDQWHRHVMMTPAACPFMTAHLLCYRVYTEVSRIRSTENTEN